MSLVKNEINAKSSSMLFYPYLKSFFERLDPERAHKYVLKGLQYGYPLLGLLLSRDIQENPEQLKIERFGRIFPNPIGLAAGFDKDAVALQPLSRLGFGFLECGGVVPLPQAGNPKPRVFRLPNSESLINRCGFNSLGLQTVRKNLELCGPLPIPLGVNAGANKSSNNFVEDYLTVYRTLAHCADFITFNLSSPNTPGLRDLQQHDPLRRLLDKVYETNSGSALSPAVVIKISPDLDLHALDQLIEVVLSYPIDGLIVSNTTVSRPEMLSKDAHAIETGGLSGRVLFEQSTRLLAETAQRTEGKVTLIGVGGVDSPLRAWIKILAGASLIQMYTGLVYKGPQLIQEIKHGLCTYLNHAKIKTIEDAIGSESKTLCQIEPTRFEQELKHMTVGEYE